MCLGLDPAKLQSKPKPYLRQRGYVIAGVCLSPYACVCLLSTWRHVNFGCHPDRSNGMILKVCEFYREMHCMQERYYAMVYVCPSVCHTLI